MAQKQRIEVHFKIKSDKEILAALQRIDGVSQVDLSHQGEFTVAHIDARLDVRPMIAKSIVDLGADLYTIGKAEDGLESLFLKLIQNG